jgi:hypothetical protein
LFSNKKNEVKKKKRENEVLIQPTRTSSETPYIVKDVDHTVQIADIRCPNLKIYRQKVHGFLLRTGEGGSVVTGE